MADVAEPYRYSSNIACVHSDLTHDASPAKSCARARNCRAGFRFCLKEMVAMPVLGNGI